MAKTDVLEKEPVEETSAVPEPPKTFSRDDIRSAVLDAPDEPILVDYRGVKIEIKAPELEELLQYRDAPDDDFLMARAIVNNCYVPDTNTRVFENADIPVLMKTRFSKDMQRLQKAITRVLGGDEAINQAVDNQTKSNQE